MGQENQNEGNGKTSWLKVLITPVVVIATIIYLFMQSAKNPVIAVDGVEFKLRDEAKVLTDAGFEFEGSPILEGETWDYFYLVKGDVCYGKVALYNMSTSASDVAECQIGEFKVETEYELYDGADKVTVNGLPAIGMSESDAKDNFGIEREGAEDTAASNKVGECSVVLSFYNSSSDVYESCSITYDFGKAY